MSDSFMSDFVDTLGTVQNYLCQSGKINNTQGTTHEDRSRCRAICS